MSFLNTRAPADSICAVLFSRGDGSFHWAIAIPSNNSQSAELLHANNLYALWSFERRTHNIYQSKSACVIVKIGTLTANNTVDRITDLLRGIPMYVPTADRTIETKFTCRVWFKQAIRVLVANGIVVCPDVYALERTMIEYGRSQDYYTRRGDGYRLHVPSSSLIY